jgi:hypothetical protein
MLRPAQRWCPHLESTGDAPVVKNLVIRALVAAAVASVAAATPHTASARAPQPISVSGPALSAQFDADMYAALRRYKGRSVRTSGYMLRVSRDLNGTPYVGLNLRRDLSHFKGLICYVSGAMQLRKLVKGQRVTVEGRIRDVAFGVLEMTPCRVA